MSRTFFRNTAGKISPIFYLANILTVCFSLASYLIFTKSNNDFQQDRIKAEINQIILVTDFVPITDVTAISAYTM